MKRNIARLILSGLMVVLLTACGENPGGISSGDSSQTQEKQLTALMITDEAPVEVMENRSLELTVKAVYDNDTDNLVDLTDESDVTLTWSSSDTEHVTVAGGTLTGVKPTLPDTPVTITVSAGDTVSTSVAVTVINELSPTNVVINEAPENPGEALSYLLDESFSLTALLEFPAGTDSRPARSDEVTWSVNNTTYISITDEAGGVFEAKSRGTTTITATAFDANGTEIQATVTVVIPGTFTHEGLTYVIIAEESDFGKMRTALTENYYLWRDIALTGDFEPIGDDNKPFRGIFEGNNKTISNLGIAKFGENYVGFFGQIGADGDFDPANPDANGVVRNLTLVLADGSEDDSIIEGANSVGALAGRSNGKIEAVGVEGGFVNGSNKVGGLVGETYGDITSSYATGSVSGTSNVGGLVGYSSANNDITSSYATGSVSGEGSHVGGLVGTKDKGSSITSSYATGSVSGEGSHVGGLVGWNNGDIKKSYATGSVTLTGTGSNIGGLVGWTNGDIKKSYATGSVTLTGTGSNIGGLVGYTSGSTITSSYFDTSSTGTNQTQGVGNVLDATGVTGITTSGITSGGREPFAAGVDWNFDGDDAVWAAQGDGQWPLLAWQ